MSFTELVEMMVDADLAAVQSGSSVHDRIVVRSASRAGEVTDKAVSRCFVAGHRGLVGSAIVRALADAGYPEPIVRTRSELDLLDQKAVARFFSEEKPDVVFFAAAKVGGINANNTYRWDFLYENLVIQSNVLGSALDAGSGARRVSSAARASIRGSPNSRSRKSIC